MPTYSAQQHHRCQYYQTQHHSGVLWREGGTQKEQAVASGATPKGWMVACTPGNTTHDSSHEQSRNAVKGENG